MLKNFISKSREYYDQGAYDKEIEMANSKEFICRKILMSVLKKHRCMPYQAVNAKT